MHRIRLHGPWSVRIVEGAWKGDPAKQESRAEFAIPALPASNSESQPTSLGSTAETVIRFPEDWDRWCDSNPLRSDQGVELSRRFGMPTGLDAGQEVWLVFIANDVEREGLLFTEPDFQCWLSDERLDKHWSRYRPRINPDESSIVEDADLNRDQPNDFRQRGHQRMPSDLEGAGFRIPIRTRLKPRNQIRLFAMNWTILASLRTILLEIEEAS